MNTQKIKKAKDLIAICQKNLIENEHNCRTLAGVRNLSASDVDAVILYAEAILQHGSYEGIFMSPCGGVEKVLDQFGLLETPKFF